ncbi:alpha/beta hydrolase [Rhabdochromatium marinum]|uniref:alpha/beta hydrolase n=1 Tax=Rhabdochromatium marinum TaxID=48729 RepID=UPI00190312BE|nr:alpha/beta hydrolase [Rhabdochromatium marinum]MBK1647181.1 alpha/beta hydrolase [Rhabdochromatium marinum]
MATLVLVHGAMHGGWCWRVVADRLTATGHRVHRPSLTGQGERSHLLTPEVGIGTHLRDLEQLFFFEAIDDAVLVLHSYAGILAGPLAERLAGKVRTLVVVGGFLARPGECLLDVQPQETRDRYLSLAREQGDGWRLPAMPRFLDQWGIRDPGLRALVTPRLTDFPLKCLTDRLTFEPAALDALRRVYIEHTDPELPSLAMSVERALGGGWEIHRIRSGHDMMLADPESTASLLDRIARGQGLEAV